MDFCRIRACCVLALLCMGGAWLVSCTSRDAGKKPQIFQTRGIIKEVSAKAVVVEHESIPGYMDAMTMPFNVKDPASLSALAPGDRIAFRLLVTDSESWIDRITRLQPSTPQEVFEPVQAPATAAPGTHPLRAYQFTNELGRPVALDDFKGKALAITFIFTRCPIPDYCPRLSRNFQAVQSQLSAMRDAPTNWHLLSVTIDPQFDTPAILRSYGARYDYNPQHWSFLTGPKDKIAELAKLSDITYEWQGSFLNHNFRTLIIDPAGGLQMSFPIGGDISSGIVEELLKAMKEPKPSP